MIKSRMNQEQTMLCHGMRAEQRDAFFCAAREMLQEQDQGTHVLLHMGVERFPTIWEVFGQEEADALCQTLEKALHSQLQGEGVSVHLGGAEFSIFMPYEKKRVHALMDALQAKMAFYPLPFRVQLRFGLCLADTLYPPLETIEARAALAMQSVQRWEEKRYAFFEETLRQQQAEIQEMRYEMQAALVDEQFDIFLQPKYDMRTGSVFGAEALVRWMHPQKGMRLPDVFLPVFERYGLIFQLDSFVWERVCRLLRKQVHVTGRALPISVNLSKVDLYHPDLCHVLCRLTERYQIAPSLLELEIPGDAYEEEPDQVLRTVQALREKGFPVWLGRCELASLHVLQALPVDGIKLSVRAFSRSEQPGTRESRLFASVVRMAQMLHIPVTAVGVEKKWQAEFLKSIGCTRAQGFHYARPMSRDQYEELVGQPFNTTEPQQAGKEEEALAGLLEQDAPLNFLFSHAVEGMALYEWRGEWPELIRANEAYVSLIGGELSALRESGRAAFGRMTEEDQQQFLSILRRARKTNQPAEGVCTLQTEADTPRWIQMKARCLSAGESGALFYLSAADITESTAMERKNIEMAETLRSLLDTLPIGIGLFEAEEKELEVSYANEAYCQMLGYSKQEYQTCAEQTPHLLIPEHAARRLRQNCMKAFKNGTVWEDIYGVRRKDGSPCAISLRLAPLPGQLGKRVFCAVCAQRPDLLDRVEMPLRPEEKEPPEPQRKERGRRLRKKTELSTFLSEQQEQQPDAAMQEETEADSKRLQLVPLEEIKAAIEDASAGAADDKVQALLIIEYEVDLDDGMKDRAEHLLLDIFPTAMICRVSAGRYLIWQANTSTDVVRGQAAQLCKERTAEMPGCSIGIAYAVPPLPPLPQILEQAVEAVSAAKTMDRGSFVESHPAGRSEDV